MDWKLAIRKNRDALAGIVAGLTAMLGQAQPVSVPRPVFRSILIFLRPAESAMRRLIVIVAAAMNVRVMARGSGDGGRLPDFASFGPGNALPAFPLIDPRRRFSPENSWAGSQASIPRVSVPGMFDPVLAEQRSDQIETTALYRRIAALDHALKTLPWQAKRLARMMARRSNARPGSGRVGPLRPGLPPGYRQRSVHPVDDILKECHFLVRDCALLPP